MSTTNSINFVERLKLINNRHKKTVYGYIRQEFMQKYKDIYIPFSIIDICIVFSFMSFLWDLDTKHKDFDANNHTLQVYHSKNTSIANIYSSTIMKEKSIYVFKIKLIGFCVSIFGIVDSKCFANTLSDKVFAFDERNAYGFGGRYGYKYMYRDCTKYGDQPKRGDIIEMRFDKINGTLSYKINDKDLGVAWNGINNDLDYKFGAYACNQRDQFQIVDF